jgi:hypothetical protein
MTLRRDASLPSTVSQLQSAIPEDVGTLPVTLWRSLRYLWCTHRRTTVTPKTDLMPAHVVCDACGWREPVIATAPPKATRTWDSTRDEARYEREKRRRLAIEQQKQSAMAQWGVSAPTPIRPRRARRGTVIHLQRTAGSAQG